MVRVEMIIYTFILYYIVTYQIVNELIWWTLQAITTGPSSALSGWVTAP